jgi:iron complex outermembrane recepter protein
MRPTTSLSRDRRLRLVSAAAVACALAAAAPAWAEAASGADLAALPLDELMRIEVTSVSKHAEPLGDAPAAVFVITQEDIRRSGMTTLPDVLRLAPGLNVAQSDANHWAVSSRGYNDVYSSKLLVLVDGRTIYSPTFAGVFWDAQDLPLDDVDRIEVVRGPGGTLWGANAVNGVINIITKSAADTRGGLVSGSAGTRGTRALTLRYGGSLSPNASYRVYLNADGDDGVVTPSGGSAGDSSSQVRGGFRLDWDLTPSDSLTAEGDIYGQRSRARLTLPSLIAPPTPVSVSEHDSGGDALISWRRRLSATSDLSVQAFFDRAVTGEYTGRFSVDTADIEARQHLVWRERHDIVWGLGYRHVDYSSVSNPILILDPSSGSTDTFNLFAQDAIRLSPDLRLIAGLKLEHNSFTGVEYEPNLRIAWTPGPGRTVWAAVSRAVRVPSIGETFLRLNVAGFPAAPPATPPILVAIVGAPDLKAEREIAFEAGFRAALSPRLTFDLALFYNRYSDLITSLTPAPVLEFSPAPPHLLFATPVANTLDGRSYGGELTANWQVTPAWRLTADYDLAHATVTILTPLATMGGANDPRNSPKHQLRVRSRLDLPHDLELDLFAGYTSRLGPTTIPGHASSPGVPAYTRLDLRLGWRPNDRLELGVVGQNLLRDRHPEFIPISLRDQSEIPRTFRIYLRAGF